MQVSITEAKNKLPELIKAVERGEQVTITSGVPIVDLVPTKGAKVTENIKPKFGTGARKLGTLRGKIKINDPNWWKPMTDQEVEMFLEEGRY